MSENMENKKEMTAEEKAKEELERLKKEMDPDEQIRKYSRGTLLLQEPIQSGELTVSELKWDFLALTGAEYADALDMDARSRDAFRISSTQGLCLFAAAAAKVTAGVDAEDIRRRLSAQDTTIAVRLSTVFFNASFRAGNKRISKER